MAVCLSCLAATEADVRVYNGPAEKVSRTFVSSHHNMLMKWSCSHPIVIDIGFISSAASNGHGIRLSPSPATWFQQA